MQTEPCGSIRNNNLEDHTSTKPESKRTGSEVKHFARRKGVPSARRKTRYSRAGRHAALRVERRTVLRVGCAPFSAPGACRSARHERAVQRAGSVPFCAPEDARAARRETCQGAPGASQVRAACAHRAGRSGLSLLAQVSWSSAVRWAAGGKRNARRGPQVRRTSPAHLRVLARLKPKPMRKDISPGFAVRLQR